MKRLHGKWGDLGVRIISALVLLAIGMIAVLSGTIIFSVFVLIVVLIGIWELVQMGRFKSANVGFAFGDFFLLSGYAFFLCLAAVSLIFLHAGLDIIGVGYLILLVIVTDTLGYFVGRIVGGKKFWPSISPKKTWAGILGGWAGVAVLALLFSSLDIMQGISPLMFVLFSVAMSFASQMGDIAESALKRRMGVKDSSNIIPGHGGVLDRFDALLAASVIMLGLIFSLI